MREVPQKIETGIVTTNVLILISIYVAFQVFKAFHIYWLVVVLSITL